MGLRLTVQHPPLEGAHRHAHPVTGGRETCTGLVCLTDHLAGTANPFVRARFCHRYNVAFDTPVRITTFGTNRFSGGHINVKANCFFPSNISASRQVTPPNSNKTLFGRGDNYYDIGGNPINSILPMGNCVEEFYIPIIGLAPR
jgi:hypothetical protein